MLVTLPEFKETRQQRYRRTNNEYSEREQQRELLRDRSDYNGRRREESRLRPFVGWDTEGTNTDATPFLFGSSRGDKIAKSGIGTLEMFNLVLAAEAREPNAIHVVFGAEYDFNMMLREVPHRALLALKTHGRVKWNGYSLQHIPRKWFIIKRDADSVTAKLFDVQSFFGTNYVAALLENGIGTAEEVARIKEGKELRGDFSYDDISYIEPYWRTELKLLPELMDKLRDAFYRASVFINNWHGPGALARFMLTQRGIKAAMKPSPPGLHDAARYAFCGGRFESVQAGLYEGPVWNADINSAYPYAATFLPNLNTGRWEYTSDVDRGKIRADEFAVYHINYEFPNTQRNGLCLPIQPLFRRYGDDRVMWPNSVTGWYWSPEAANVAGDSRARFTEAYIYRDDGSRPFSWLNEYYDHRRVLQKMNDPMEIAFKLGPNSVYGQLAQRAGWQFYNGPPKFHQLEWAGYVTSMCRAMVHNAAMEAWESNSLISIDTDGIFTTAPIPDSSLVNGSGDNLGQWKVKQVPGILYWQSGVYWIPDETGEWKLKKARGAPKGKIPYGAAMESLQTLAPIKYKRSELIGYRWGLRNGMDTWRYFVTKDRQIQFGGSEYSKRYHNPRGCRKCRGFTDQTMHDLSPIGNGMAMVNHSKMHVLPWETNDHERARDPIDVANDGMIDMIWTEE